MTQIQWNGPICPSCNRPYLQQAWGSMTTTVNHPYVPKHRKPGPAQ